jgi:penicillin-binding protein 1A
MSESESSGSPNLRYRIRRDAGNLLNWLRRTWRDRRWFRRFSYLAGAMLIVFGGFFFVLTRDLPSTDKLLEYQPPLPTMVRGGDGEIIYSYARERRVQLNFDDFPEPLINAFLSAEDKTFWSHGGVDLTGLAGAVVDYVSKIGTGERAKGGSTITQQVAKNILIGDEYSVTRKLKEMILASRIEETLDKQQILELYLNEIPLGRQSFGVQAAARAYYNKDVGDLKLHEAAFLSILPKAPERYGRKQHEALAIERRNYVLDQMVDNGWATEQEAADAKARPLGLIARRAQVYDPAVGYFVEEVRRRLISRYGETAEDGPNSVYAGGLWVRTSVDMEMQRATRDALRDGLVRFRPGQGWHGPIAHIDLDPEQWRSQLALQNISVNYKDWRVGVLLEVSGSSGRIGFADGDTGPISGLPQAARVGNVVAAAQQGGGWAIRYIPEVSGGMVVEQVGTGRVVAMQGGFDSGLGSFNRATQAMRQPGSTIKPFVYATALENGLTPASQISDGDFCVYQGASLGMKCIRGGGASGNHTMRWGLEQSRNRMTVRVANDTGIEKVVKTYKDFGIGEHEPYLSSALGAGETTILKMVNAYAALANNGLQFTPSVIDYVQDRNGKVIWKSDNRRCAGCNMDEWDGRPMPRIPRSGRQAIDPGTAFQVVHMLTGVITRGTATRLADLELPLFGKTGTTTGPKDVWFIGGSQRFVAGVYLGYDQPRSLGGWAQGGRVAAPIVKDLILKTKKRWSTEPFVAPAGIRMVRIDRNSGTRVYGAEPGDDPKSAVIWEAFKPDTEPRRFSAIDRFIEQRDALIAEIKANRKTAVSNDDIMSIIDQKDFAEQQGGIY